MNNQHPFLGILLMLAYVADALLLAGAGVVGLGFIFLAGAHPLLMSAPVGIAVFTGWAFGLSLKRRADHLVQALAIGASPLLFAPVWYGLIVKITESNCRGWTCF
ncbi:hypothetical protein [Rhodoferax sp. BAB1]|uniref:hypothetical protein n=1 Tax=Rhodoferax sp. BAB1 TaxID=2741720 RepID=UPI001577100D|nr:hypothetical protein [Rhodoferax sp. BAB1]QKO23110.1 hypothetical protein HTY51_15070 [Rhodoferax sp. BAB1]